MIFKTNFFNKIINESTRGSVRQILAFDILDSLKIPLPPLEIQKKLVQTYQNRLNLAILQEQQAKDKEIEIEEYLYKELGIEIVEKKKEKKILSFINFKEIGRWDTIFLLDSNNIKSKYDLIPISDIINTFLKDLDNNSLRIDSKKYPLKDFKYIGMENIEKETGKLLQFQDVKGIDIRSTTIQLPKNFFLYGKLRPYLNKYYLNKNDKENIIISSEFFVFSVKNIQEMYFKYILSSSFIQNQIKNHMKGARMPRISEETFKSLKIPLPSLNIQNNIANNINILKDDIQKLKKQAINNKNLALKEFEKEIFNEA
jgi:restriction endonuclease S subunit